MKYIALKLPGSQAIPSPSGLKSEFKDLAGFITPLLDIVFFSAVFMAFFWLAWGAFAYIMAQGKKEDLAKARSRILWALIGLAVTLLAFFIAKFISEVFEPTTGGLPF